MEYKISMSPSNSVLGCSPVLGSASIRRLALQLEINDVWLYLSELEGGLNNCL